MKLSFFKNYLENPYKRIEATHFLVIAILLVNIVFLTNDFFSILLQSLLIIAVFLHNRDDMTLKHTLQDKEREISEDRDIFYKNIIVSESDLQGNITYANEKFCEISGYTEEELIGKPHSIVRHPETPKTFFETMWNTLKAEEKFHGVIKNRKKDGSAYWVDVSIIPIKKKNRLMGYRAIRFDITNQVLMEEQLQHESDVKEVLIQKQSNRFNFAINSSRDGFWDYDIASKEFYLSSGWKERLGFKNEEKVSYLDYLDLIPEKNRFEHHIQMHDIIENSSSEVKYVHFCVKYPLITKSGEQLLIEDVGDAFCNEHKDVTHLTGFHRDITDQERQRKIIESQNRVSAMGEVMGNIAHQWRQPIGAINNTLNDLEFDIELEELEVIDTQKVLAVTKKVKEYTSHLSQTIDDFRDLTSHKKEKSLFLVKEVLAEAFKITTHEYEKYSIKITILEIDKCVCKIYGYPRELLQVLLNILNNAKDVLVEKEIKSPEVVVSMQRDEETLSICIRDNAGGVPLSVIDKIFDPYFTTKHESIGTGIGLYMSKKIIDNDFEGHLEVINEDGGANFVISLPRVEKTLS